MAGKTQQTRKTYQVGLSKNALQNIDEIVGFVAFINHQPLNAIRIGEAIFSVIDRIESNPFSFNECSLIPTKTKMYRQAVCSSWYIIYKVVGLDITVLGIIHSSRKPSKIKTLRKIKQ